MEGLRKTQGHIWRNSAALIDDLRESLTRDPECICGLGNANMQRLQILPLQYSPWVCRWTCPFTHTTSSPRLVIIHVVYVGSIAVFKSENNPPITRDFDGPIACQLPG